MVGRTSPRQQEATIRAKVREAEDSLKELRTHWAELQERRAAVAGNQVGRRWEDLQRVLMNGGADQGDLDRARTNQLLRQLFRGITVDYKGGRLSFQWHHGGATEVPYG